MAARSCRASVTDQCPKLGVERTHAEVVFGPFMTPSGRWDFRPTCEVPMDFGRHRPTNEGVV